MLDYLVGRVAKLDRLESIEIVTNRRYAATYQAWAQSHPLQSRLQVHDDGTSHADDRLGAVGDLRFVLERLPTLRGAVVAAGDNIFRFSITPAWRAFCETGCSHVLALEEKNPEELRQTGVLELSPSGRVLRLTEKPAMPSSTWACPALYFLNRNALQEVGPYLDAGNPRDEIGRFISHLVGVQEVFAYVSQGERLHVGNPAEYAKAIASMGDSNPPSLD